MGTNILFMGVLLIVLIRSTLRSIDRFDELSEYTLVLVVFRIGMELYAYLYIWNVVVK